MIRRRKKRMRALVIRTSHKFLRRDGMSFKFHKNSLVILRKRMNALGREVVGPTSKEMKIKKFRKSIITIF
jgi:ribosomal protein L14